MLNRVKQLTACVHMHWYEFLRKPQCRRCTAVHGPINHPRPDSCVCCVQNNWNGWTPTIQHREIKADLYYSNDAKFVQDIPEFKAMDHYVMRWRGQVVINIIH